MAKCLCGAAKQVLDQLQNYNIVHIDVINARGTVRNRDLVQAERNYEKYRTKCKCQEHSSNDKRRSKENSLADDSDWEEDVYGSPEGDCVQCLLITSGIAKSQCGRCRFAASQLCLGRITPRAREISNSVMGLCPFCSKRSQKEEACHCAEQFLYLLNFEPTKEKRKIGIERVFSIEVSAALLRGYKRVYNAIYREKN